MSRTITVHDDDADILASITIETSNGDHRTTEVRFTAGPGASITGKDLYLLEAFGLRLPAPTRAIDPAPVIKAATSPAPKPAKKAARKAPARPRKKARRFPRPDDEALLRLWDEHDRTTAFIAREIGCSPQTVLNWVAEARERGVDFPAKQK